MLKNEMWKIFKNTGNINAYLYYSDSKKHQNEEKNDDIVSSSKVKVLQGL